MDYYQGVVTEYLRADRAMFLNTECCIQLNPGANPDTSGPHWYCDAVAVNLRDERVFLCEVTYSKSLDALSKRLDSWAKSWNLLLVALERDCGVRQEWPVLPWLFVPKNLRSTLESRINKIQNIGEDPGQMPRPKITDLEEVAPWKYPSWNRHDASQSENQ